MQSSDGKSALKKVLGTKDLFSIAAGAMISSGIFVLPAVIYPIAGPSIIVSYILAAILVIPAMFSKIELSTAMPKAGGTYFFVHRSHGALLGTFAGFASWFSVSMKSAFALVGIGIFVQPLLPEASDIIVKIVAVIFTVFFTMLNIKGAKSSARFQNTLVFFLILILAVYIGVGAEFLDANRYIPFRPYGWESIFTVTGMIFVSFGGLTKVAAVAEEVKQPRRSIPLGMVTAFIVVTIIYAMSAFVTVGLLDKTDFMSTLIPLSSGASKFAGTPGFFILAIAGMLAFITTANAGIFSASRVPLAMAKDNLIPSFFSYIDQKLGTPVISIIFTSVFMACVILFLDLTTLVKVASTMKLLLFAFTNISVIIMRESRIFSYKPSLRSPFYPYIQIISTFIYFFLIIEMGKTSLLITLFFLFLSIMWFLFYSRSRDEKKSALLHIVERILPSKIKTPTLSDELRKILIERDEIVEDRFDEEIKECEIIDIEEEITLENLFEILSEKYGSNLDIPSEKVLELLKEREAETTTIISPELAIPHIIIEGNKKFSIIVLRAKKGIFHKKGVEPIHIVFALAGTKDERNFHLQALMAIAQIASKRRFSDNWLKASSVETLRTLILTTHRRRN